MEDQQQTASRGPEGVPKTADGAIQDAPPAQSKANATEASAAPHNASASASTSAPAVPPADDAANLEPATRGIDEAVDQDKTNAEPATAGMELATTTEPAPSSSSPSTTNAPPAVPSTNEEPATAGMDITLDPTPATAAEKVITGNNAEPATAGMDQAVPPAADNESLGPHQDTTGDAVVAQPPDASASASSANGNKDESNDTNMEPATDGMDLAATAATASIDNQNGKFPEAVPSAYTEKGAQQVHQNGNGDENGAGQGTADDKSNDARTDAEAANPPPVSSTGNPDFDELISKDLAVKIYIGGLPDHTEKGDLEDCFGQFGEIDHIQLKTGYAFIDYVKTGSAKAAIETYDGGVFLGETLKVEASRSTATQKKNVETNSCFTCGSRDHYARQCPKDPRNAGKLEGAYKPQYAHHRTRSPPPSRDGRDRDRDRDRERDFRPRDSRDRDLDRDRDRRDERYREPRRVDPRDDRDRERERDRGLDRGRYGDGPERRRSPPPYSRDRERDRDFAREPDRAGARDPREDYASRDRDRRPYEPPAREPLHQSVRGDHRERDAPLSYRGGREEYDRSDRDRDYRRGAGPGEPSGAHFPPAGMPAPGYAPMGVPPYPPYDGMPPPAHLYGSEPPFYPGGSSDRGGGGAPPGFPPAHHFPPPAHMFAAGPGYIPQGAVPPLLPRGAFDPRGGPGAPTPSGYYGTIAGRGEEYPPPGASRLLDDRDRDRDRRDPGREREREPRPSVRDGRDERAVPPPPPVSARSSERDYRDPRERDEREAYYRREGGGAGGAPFPPRGYPVAGPEGGDRDRERARDRDREREREPMRERERVGYPPYGSLPPPGYPGFAGPESAFYPPPPSGRMLPPGVGAGAGAPPAYPPRFEPPMSAGSPRSSGPYRGRDDQDDRFHPYAGQPPPRRGERE